VGTLKAAGAVALRDLSPSSIGSYHNNKSEGTKSKKSKKSKKAKKKNLPVWEDMVQLGSYVVSSSA
jgi:hypothetical protein